jgi:hypothetical protein
MDLMIPVLRLILVLPMGLMIPVLLMDLMILEGLEHQQVPKHY